MQRLLGDAGIIRHRGKIEAAIANARATRRAAGGGETLTELLWSFAPAGRPAAPVPQALSDMPASTPESKALARELKRRGFRFVGPTTAYALMQATGIVNDHVAGCFVRDDVEAERARRAGAGAARRYGLRPRRARGGRRAASATVGAAHAQRPRR